MAMASNGAARAFSTMRGAGGLVPLEGVDDRLARRHGTRTSAVPPPATMPSSTAARVADSASSMRCFFSLSSTSVAAPTLTTATPPASLARRSCSFSRSQSESVSSISRLIWAMRPFTSSSEPAPSTMVVSSFVTMTRRALPSRSMVVVSSFRPISSEIDLGAREDGDVLEHRLAALTEARGLDGHRGEGAADLVDDQRGEGLALDVLGDDQQRLAGLHDLLEHGHEVVDGADLGVDDEDVAGRRGRPPGARRRSRSTATGSPCRTACPR